MEERTRDLVNASQELRELSARIQQAQDEERRRLAREVHDGVGQLLAAASMEIANVMGVTEIQNSAESASVANLQSLITQVNQDIRTMSYLLYPPLLDEVGLKSALIEYVHGFAERSRIDVTLDISPDLTRLERGLELCLFRIVQECLTNIHRHAESKSAEICVNSKDAVLTLTVRDHGKGMPAERLAEIQSKGSGVGIRGMRERVRHFGGEVTFESDGSGTSVFVVLPVPRIVVHAASSESIQAAA